MRQPTLWEPPPPPTGPAKDVARFGKGTREGYIWWRSSTEEGRRVWAYVERIALTDAARGDERISVKNLCEKAREYLRVELNNTYTAYVADDLVARHPHLLDLIERRKRRHGP